MVIDNQIFYSKWLGLPVVILLIFGFLAFRTLLQQVLMLKITIQSVVTDSHWCPATASVGDLQLSLNDKNEGFSPF